MRPSLRSLKLEVQCGQIMAMLMRVGVYDSPHMVPKSYIVVLKTKHGCMSCLWNAPQLLWCNSVLGGFDIWLLSNWLPFRCMFVYSYETGLQLLGYRPLLEDFKVSDSENVSESCFVCTTFWEYCFYTQGISCGWTTLAARRRMMTRMRRWRVVGFDFYNVNKWTMVM